MNTPGSYLYRCTEQQLEEHLARIADAGDTVEHIIFKGGRDYVLVCRPATETVATVRLASESVDAITDAIRSLDHSVSYTYERPSVVSSARRS